MRSEEIVELLDHFGLKYCVMAHFIFEAGRLAIVDAKIEIPADVGRAFIQKMKKYKLEEINSETENQTDTCDHYPDVDIPRHTCEYHEKAVCGRCMGCYHDKINCNRYKKIIQDKDADFLLHGDEPGSKARQK